MTKKKKWRNPFQKILLIVVTADGENSLKKISNWGEVKISKYQYSV